MSKQVLKQQIYIYQMNRLQRIRNQAIDACELAKQRKVERLIKAIEPKVNLLTTFSNN